MFLDESWAFEKSDCSSPMEVDMPEVERYEILVIGSGETGKHVTWSFAQAGHRTAVVERKYIGGSCPNIACLPSKNVIRSAKANWFARHGAQYGIQSGPVSTDMKGVLNRKRKMVEAEVQAHLDGFKAPLIIFQGADDPIVPPNQSGLIATALRARKVPLAYILYPGEGHGFRKPENIINSLQSELSFYGQVFGFTPAGQLPKLTIEGLPPAT